MKSQSPAPSSPRFFVSSSLRLFAPSSFRPFAPSPLDFARGDHPTPTPTPTHRHRSLVTGHSSPTPTPSHRSLVTGHSSLILILILILSSCKGVEDIRLTGVSDFAFRGIENNVVTFSARVGVANPSAVGFRLTDMQVRTLVDGNFIGTISTPDHVKVKARSDSSYIMTFHLTMGNMLTGASSLYSISRKKKVNVEMQGNITARSWMTKHRTEIHESRTVDVPSINR
jgi:hypothetical protein